jgi:hypothetical protein
MMKRIIVVFLLMMGLVSISLADKQGIEDITAIAWSPDGNYIAISYTTGNVAVSDITQSLPPLRLKYDQRVSSISWNPESNALAIYTPSNGSIWIWSMTAKKNIAQLKGYISRDNEGIVSWSEANLIASNAHQWDGGNPVQIWQQGADGFISFSTNFPYPAYDLSWDHTGTQLAIAAINGLVLVTFDGHKIDHEQVLYSPSTWATSADWSASNTTLAFTTGEGRLKFIDPVTRDILTEYNVGDKYDFSRVRWSPQTPELAFYFEQAGLSFLARNFTLNSLLSTDVVTQSNGRYFAWSPFGGRLAIVRASAENAQPSNIPGLQFVVPAPSFDLIENIESACVPADVMAQLPDAETDIDVYIDSVAQNEAIAPGCAADLVAVAEEMEK